MGLVADSGSRWLPTKRARPDRRDAAVAPRCLPVRLLPILGNPHFTLLAVSTHTLPRLPRAPRI